MITIVDYGMGNLGSIISIIKRMGGRALASNDPAVIDKAEKLILPGVGAFDNAMDNLEKLNLKVVLQKKVIGEGVPILGICLGMQLFTKSSDEGSLPGFGWIDAQTKSFNFDASNKQLKIPHMGWNLLQPIKSSPLLDQLVDQPRFYFAHSYHLQCQDNDSILGQTEFGYQFTSCIHKNNIMGVQFHPEKSHKFGMRIMKNFIENF